MNKVLFVIRFLLFHLVVLLFFLAVRLTDFVGLAEFVFVLMLIFYEIIMFYDIIKKNGMSKNKRYNILSIVVFIMIGLILLRCLGDPHFIYYNKAFSKELYEYENIVYGGLGDRTQQFLDMIQYYLINNVYYFITMFILLFVHRKLNLSIKSKIKDIC